ncbi:AAA family ATPase [Novosphingobium sp. FSY-8]|uniref:AAA family ATPase n=1 Tax=Novosphingobium ovatum TaxID=1908523 RepID=A0ABW9XGR9_9SPHN|nr:AAA domain-containing protein [Novosphingobium ovatum]NBC37753.1 AAA family ATPase [Novosphingobium ovatum]
MSLKDQIVAELKAKPNQKADALARALGVDRALVNKALYGALKGLVAQDRAYRWALVDSAPKGPAGGAPEGPAFANTDLARLCRYYLACLGYDDTGVSTFLTSKFGDPDYIELRALPHSADDFAESEAARRMLGRKRAEQGRYGLYFGYPTHVSHLRSKKSGWEGFMVEPILLFPIEHDKSGRMSVDLAYPIINQKPFQAFTNAERDMMMNELVQLEQELGIGEADARIDVDEMAMRLQAVRPEWPWREDIEPDAIGASRPPMSEIDEPGIHNRAVIIMAEKSPFTQGLEKELRDLASLPEQSYANTALGRWIKNTAPENPETAQSVPVLQVLPMNSEQRQAVATALSAPVTIITGPPGTGKSQVVTNLLINAAWSGKRVLFASKNNKAVDVVETRVNALGSRPVLLRVGSQAYQARLAEYVLALLSSTTSPSEQAEFKEAQAIHLRLIAEHDRLANETGRLIELRNQIDQAEQVAEFARQRLGAKLFAESPAFDLASLKAQLSAIAVAAARADRSGAPAIVRALWPLFRSGRFHALRSAAAASSSMFAAIGIDWPAGPTCDAECGAWATALEATSQRLEDLEKAASYLTALRALQASRPLEAIARDEKAVQDRIARQSQMLWKLWLRLQPSQLSAADRQKLGKYTSILKMVMEAGGDGQLTKQVYAKYNAMLREVSHLLPCWAVTSLSARGRIPLEAGNFDIVVFDEASQCDIASALPLLYRAKSVVIIGDPKQLSHISGLQRGQDQAMLEKYDLLDTFPHWAYSHQSLFGLGTTQVAGPGVVSLVDHHRSHSDIISFSNKEFYEERLRVATRYDDLKSPNRSEPGIRWVDVKGQASRPGGGGAVNLIEAKAVVQVLRDLVLRNGYRGSIGVVTPFRAQANAITQLVNQDKELLPVLIARGFLADTVHKFQGDERDVMVFSPVVASGLPAGAEGFLRSNGNLFNVAITRARAQLIVVGDRAGCASSNIGYLARFANYSTGLEQQAFQDIERREIQLGPVYPPVARPELVSDWEREFYVAAYTAGLALIPQYNVEKYILDFLLCDGDRLLAIEIDGERYHRNWTGELCRRDQIRNQRLIELGYDVMRFWVYEVRDDMAGCLNKLRQWQSGAV